MSPSNKRTAGGAPLDPPVIRTIAMPADTNPAGDIFGGWLMSQMDLAAASIATLRAQGRCVTVSVEGMSFLRPVLVGDEVSLYACLVRVGRTSMQIEVEAWRRQRDKPDLTKVTQATFSFVAVDLGGKPRALPPDPGA